jgi:hypothetical protein
VSPVPTRIEIVEPVPPEVPVGAGVALKVKVAGAAGSDLRGGRVDVMAAEERVTSRELSECREGFAATDAFTVTAPHRVGAFAWTIVFPAQQIGGVAYAQSAVTLAARTRPHQTSLAVWAVPSPVRIGECFAVTVGAKSSGACPLGGAKVEICDETGAVTSKGILGDTPWPETRALYWTEIALAATSRDGLFRWTARFAAAELQLPHEGSSAEFSFAAVKRPEHRLTVTVVERDVAAPVADVQLALGPYRAATDAAGLARIDAPAGTFELAVWKSGFEAAPMAVEITADTSVQVELTRLPEEVKAWG